MQTAVSNESLSEIEKAAHPLTGARTDYDPLIRMIGGVLAKITDPYSSASGGKIHSEARFTVLSAAPTRNQR
jgi:hypothetical protein